MSFRDFEGEVDAVGCASCPTPSSAMLPLRLRISPDDEEEESGGVRGGDRGCG